MGYGDAEFRFPSRKIVLRISVDGFIGTSVILQIGLSIALQMRVTRKDRTSYWFFVKAGGPEAIMRILCIFVSITPRQSDLDAE